MTALKHSDRKLRRNTGERVTLVNIQHGDRLNNDSRAPFWNGPSAARALLLHAAEQLGDPNTGPGYFNRLREIHKNTTLTGENLRRIQNARSAASQAALERSDIAIDSERELNLINDIAQIHKVMGARLMPELQANGVAPERIIPIVDDLTRRALRAATAVRTGEVVAVQTPNRVGDAADSLEARLGRVPGDSTGDRAIVDALVAAARSGEGMDAAREALQARLANEPEVVPGRVIPEGRTAAEIDAAGIASRFERLVVTDREGAGSEEQINPNAWQNDLVSRLDAAPKVEAGRGSDELSELTNAELVVRFASAIYDLESLLPTRVERAPDEQLYDIDESIDPTEFARSRDRINGALGEALTAEDIESRDAAAAMSVYGAMTQQEREEAALTIAMTPSERVELGMKVIGSTPSIITLPEIELGQGRRDVSMATTEEAVVMDALITWASTHRTFPGTEAARGEVTDMLRDNSTSAVLGANTLGIAVANNPALIAHARSTIAAHTEQFPEDRVIIHSDMPQVAEDLMAYRAELLRAQGREHTYSDGADATREFGGWTLPGNQDRVLGNGRFDTDVFVAASDQVMTFATPSQLDATGIGRATDRFNAARTSQRAAEKAVKDAAEKLGPDHAGRVEDVLAAVPGSEAHAAAVKTLNGAAPRPLANALVRAQGVLRSAIVNVSAAEKHLETLDRQNAALVYSRATRGEVLMAEIIDGAKRRDKLAKSFASMPQSKEALEAEASRAKGERRRGNAFISTPEGLIRDQNTFTAQAEASKLLNGRAYEQRQLEDALSNGVDARYDGTRNLHVEGFLASNFFNRVTKEVADQETGKTRRVSVMRPKLDEHGKQQKWQGGPNKGKTVMEPVIDNRGLEAMIERAASMPKSTVFMIEAKSRDTKRPSNPAVDAMTHFAKQTGRDIIQATGWRVTDRSEVINEGRKVNISERTTEVDYGVVVSKDGEGRNRVLNPQDMKGKVIQMNGGGQMSRATWDAIREYRAAQGDQKPLTPAVAQKIHASLVANGHVYLDAPTMPRAEQSDSIMIEAIAITTKGATIGTDRGSDFRGAQHFANHDRLGKVTAAIDQDGTILTLEQMRSHSYPMAPSISDLTRQNLQEGGVLERSSVSDTSQLILTSFKGVSPQSARDLGERYETLGDIMESAKAGTLEVRVPHDVAHQLGRPKAWQEAVERADTIMDNLDAAGMSGFTAASPDYPKSMLDAAAAVIAERAARASGESDDRSPLTSVAIPPLFTKGDVDMNVPAVALVIGGDARPSDSDIEAAKRIAQEANEKDMSVSIHLSGEASARIATELANMDENARPRLLLVGDGHPNAYTRPAERQAIDAVTALGDGGYVTATPPLVKEDGGLDAFVSNRRNALDLQAHHASAVIVVKSTGEDIELLGLRTAINAGKPVAAVGPVTSDPSMADIRFRGAEYSANRRLLAGGDSVSILTDERHLAFVPNFIPISPEVRYVPFEGSTEGMMNSNDRNRGQDEDNQRGAIESGGRISTKVSWSAPAHSVEDGRGTGAFLDQVASGEARSIVASPKDIALKDLENDVKFLDRVSRNGVSADVERVFSDIQAESGEDATALLHQQMMSQRSGAGR